MHRAIGYLSKRFVQIRPGEGRRTVLTFLYFFLIITAYYLIKPVSRSLVLGELGSRLVPYADLICAVLMGPVVTLFARLVDRVPKSTLVSGSFGAVIAILLVFWKLLGLPAPWVAGVFYIWVAIFSVLVVTLFWLVANDLYRPREAKRLFGFIGSGGILGGIVGSSLAAAWAKVLGTENLILLSAALLCLCWLLVQELWTLTPERAAEEERSSSHPRRETFLSNVGGFVKLLLESRYLLLLVAVVGLSKLVGTLVYYQFNPFIERTFPDLDARTAFTGAFFGGMNVVAFIIQFFFTSWVLRRWGIFTALLAMPLGLLLGTAGLLVFPAFWLAAGTELYDGSLNYSLHQTTKEVLYLPIDRSIRYKVKPFIDMVVFRFGKGIAALIGIVLLDGFHMAPQGLSYVAIPLVGAWLLAAVQLRRDYVVRIRTILQARAASRHAAPPAPSSEAPPAVRMAGTILFRSLADAPSSGRKLALVNRLVGASARWSADAAAFLAELAAYETRGEQPAADRLRVAELLRRTISDPREPMAARCQAIRRLAGLPEQATVDYLFGIAMVEADVVLRQEALCGLVRLRLRGGGTLEFLPQPVRRQIAREVANYERIAQVAQVYRRHHGGAVSADDPLLGLFRALMEETVEQVFRLLVLLYRPDDIQLVYEQLSAPDAYLRADAIELLDNLVDPPMRRVIAPILDEDRFLSALEGPPPVADPVQTHRLLQDAIWDHNCWLSVTTLCVVGRLRLPAMRPELEKAAHHTTALVSKAAKLALHFSEQP
ncbi:MAG: MFS transporter [Candidatus Omnitrophica bacterium]|nr:MFS transporter [Candidatus Omnitrophota bacterium]